MLIGWRQKLSWKKFCPHRGLTGGKTLAMMRRSGTGKPLRSFLKGGEGRRTVLYNNPVSEGECEADYQAAQPSTCG
jgi:hypothetical protein